MSNQQTYRETLRTTLHTRMKLDPSIVILGQDLSLWGGAGNVFEGFSHDFPGRIIDTPISEAATAGIAVGMAMQGMRPIVEHTFMDFSLHAMDQIINQAAKMSALSNGQFTTPVIYRMVVNSARSYGATHSQSLESLFTDIPGLHVFFPATPQDVNEVINYALSSAVPSVIVEHKLLHDISGDVVDTISENITASVMSEGEKLTIITHGRMVQETMIATKDIPDITVINLKTLSPLDVETILISAETGKVLLIEEGYGAITAKVAALLTDAGFNGRIKRLTSQFEPLLQNRESIILPNSISIGKAITALLSE
jgi:pyruvate/2-oxoglutarate/acetoin dehydrogenase E1 component